MQIGQQPEGRTFFVRLGCSLSDLPSVFAEKMGDRAAFWKRVWPRWPAFQFSKRDDPPLRVFSHEDSPESQDWRETTDLCPELTNRRSPLKRF
jgi:hypothetical protein